MSSNVIAVVGPSGAGKDTLMRAAARALPTIRLARRAITRPCEDSSEDFEAVAADEFARRRAKGDFVLDWQAHGLRYGVPHPSGAGIWLMNLSRRVLPQAAGALPGLGVIHVTADPATLAARLAGRGRESATDISTRIARDACFDAAGLTVITIDNSGALADARSAFIAAVQELSQ
ncbi:AAA family ATPase [Paracoccus xiamenensis]|uniref:AAA family ATPase n=1 Tax=Paracoccus xiamenensis TaxID=2714901 RepID=UPI001409B747|nr:AAA family ATPase [Paracoccus xiamenensis]NHF74506.1 AAA family ATPase [Paracoccus xiamenensis]